MIGTADDSQPAEPLAEVPLSVFSQSSSLMSDRATQAMEKALRNLANPNMYVRLSGFFCCHSCLLCLFASVWRH